MRRERLPTCYQTCYRRQLKFSSLQFARSAAPNNGNRDVSRRSRDGLELSDIEKKILSRKKLQRSFRKIRELQKRGLRRLKCTDGNYFLHYTHPSAFFHCESSESNAAQLSLLIKLLSILARTIVRMSRTVPRTFVIRSRLHLAALNCVRESR